MKKISTIFTTILFLFLTTLFVEAQDLRGGVSYTENTARIEAFSGLKIHNMSYKNSPKYYFDPENKENVAGVAQTSAKLFKLLPCKFYSVVYKDDTQKEFIYVNGGKENRLAAYIIYDTYPSYPKRHAKYSVSGDLLSVEFAVSDYESFVYNAKGALYAHWKDGSGKGRKFGITMKQESVEYND